MTKCNHNIHEYCIGRRCRYAEPTDDEGMAGICVLDYRYNNPEDDEED